VKGLNEVTVRDRERSRAIFEWTNEERGGSGSYMRKTRW